MGDREQLELKTEALRDDRHPTWHSTLIGECRPRPSSFVHFRLMNDEKISAQDRGIGQTAIPLADVLKNIWFGSRSIALFPLDRKNQKKWAQLYDTRLVISITWEGIKTQPFKTNPMAMGNIIAAGDVAKRIAAKKHKKVRIQDAT